MTPPPKAPSVATQTRVVLSLNKAAHKLVDNTDYNHVRPHEAIAWNRPAEVHAGRADPPIPNCDRKGILPLT